MRRTVSPVLVALVLLTVAWPARAAGGDRSKDVAAAQKRANAAAARLAAAQSAAARVQAEVAELERRTAEAKGKVDELGTRVRTLAVEQYVTGKPTVPLVSGDPSRAVRGQAMLRIVTAADVDDLDRFRVARDDLAESREALAQRLAERRAVLSKLKADQRKAVQELERLAAAQRAYEERKAAESRAAAARARASRQATSATASRSGGARVIGSGSWICPVQGPRSFTNDWGQPRSGGRRHQGTDILAPRGTPVVASVSGTVRGHNSRLGGLSYYLSGDDGNTYFGTHLQSLSGASGRVSAGTVVGYVGNSGNAAGGPPHLHFEIHPGGGGPVNPYPTLAKYC
jgi:murein DD-endopeptidase MepM/ murein hydrolase activator NlpD